MTEPIKAAAGIILSDEPQPRVLLAKRNDTLRFMGGYHVFPGGRIDENEPIDRIRGAVNDSEAAGIHAAAREIFEEAGLLIADGAVPDAAARSAARHEILNGTLSFDIFLERHNMTLNAARFEAAGVWVTPEVAPIRFHTRYYLVRPPEQQREELIPGEIVALEWITPADARRRWRQGSLQIPPPVAYVLRQLAAFPYPHVFDHLRYAGGHEPGRPKRMEFHCGIYLLPQLSATLPPATHTNCVIIGERELVVIDPGAHNAEELELLQTQLNELMEEGGRLSAVVLTHSHIDHIGGAEFLRERYGAPIWAHKAAAAQLDFAVDRHLSDNEEIPVAGDPDWRLRCIHTPGHDPGHLCFLEETTQTLIAGDMLANPGTIVISTDLGGDMTQFLESLERLLREDYDLLLPGHGMPVNRGKDKIRKHLEHRLWREGKIKGALDDGASNINDLIARAYDDTPKEIWPLAELSLRAHLVRLGVQIP